MGKIDDWFSDSVNRGTCLSVMMLVAFVEFMLIAAFIVAHMGTEPVGHIDTATVYDSPSHVVEYIDADCPVCGEPAIATAYEIVCTNGACDMHGLVQEQR